METLVAFLPENRSGRAPAHRSAGLRSIPWTPVPKQVRLNRLVEVIKTRKDRLMDATEARGMVRARCGSSAASTVSDSRASSSSSCCAASAGGPAERKPLQMGYSAKDLTAVPEGADLGLGCGNPALIEATRRTRCRVVENRWKRLANYAVQSCMCSKARRASSGRSTSTGRSSGKGLRRRSVLAISRTA